MSPYKLDKIEAPMRLSLAFNEAFNDHDVEGMLALLAADCVIEHYAPAPDGTRYAGHDALEAFWQDYFAAYPDVQRRIEDVYGMGKRCVMHWRLTHGESPSLRGIDVFTTSDEFIVEQISYVKG